MQEYISGKAKVRIHGEAKREKIEPAMVKFLKKAQKKKRGQKREST